MATRLRPSFSIPDFFKEILIILLQCDMCCYPCAGLSDRPLLDFCLDLSEAMRDGKSFHEIDWVAVQILHEMPLMPYNLSIECQNVNTGNGDLHRWWESTNKVKKNFKLLFSAGKFVLCRYGQNNKLENHLRLVFNVWADYEKFLAEWWISERLIPRTLKRTA